MDNREAKFILSAYRPNGRDANDPRFAEALEQARRDPILERWFEESIALDAAVTEKLCTVAVPVDLRENIVAGVKISRPLRGRFRWGIAAALILLASLGSLIWQNARPAHLAGWQSEAISVISSLIGNKSTFDAQSHNPDELVRWLRSNDTPAAPTLPRNLDNLESLGCKTFSWNGTPVSVICFMRPDGGLIHLVAISVTPATNRGTKVEPKFVQQGDWAMATWREGDRIYMLALEGSPDQLRSYLL